MKSVVDSNEYFHRKKEHCNIEIEVQYVWFMIVRFRVIGIVESRVCSAYVVDRRIGKVRRKTSTLGICFIRIYVHCQWGVVRSKYRSLSDDSGIWTINTFWSNCVLVFPHFDFILDFRFRRRSTHTHAHIACSCETFTSVDHRSAHIRFSFIRLYIYFISSEYAVSVRDSSALQIGAFSHRIFNEHISHDTPIWCSLYVSVCLIESARIVEASGTFIEWINQSRHPEMNGRKKRIKKKRFSFSILVYFSNGRSAIVLFMPSSVCVYVKRRE